MTQITRFSIERFRQFDKPVYIDLRPITLLIGPNNGGKTAVLQALTLFQYCIENCITRNGNPNGEGVLSLKSAYLDTDDFSRLPLASPADLWPQGRVKGAIRITAAFLSGGSLTFEIELKYNRFNIKPTCQGITNLDELLHNFAIRLIPVFSGLLPREEFLVLPSRLERQRSQRYGEIVRNLLWSLKSESPQRFKLFGKLLQRLYPDALIDVNYDPELGARIASAKIDSQYHDTILTSDRDLIVAGSGVHQAIQILSGILQPGVSTVLLDEPDAHLHARLQDLLMLILTELAETEGIQFIIATHSPQLLRTAPEGSITICRKGMIVPFSPSPDQLEILDHLGALDRMEIVPLIQTKRVVFVENREDKHLIELFGRKYFGEKSDDVLGALTFLYTYQEPVSSNVLDKARQVHDLLHDPSLQALGVREDVAFLCVGDRDYRMESDIVREEHAHARKARQQGFGFEFKLLVWRRTEIENYLLDIDAMCGAVEKIAEERGLASRWKPITDDFREFVGEQIQQQRGGIIERFAARLQDRDRRKNLQTAMDEARDVLDQNWGNGIGWCDAKVAISAARRFLQSKGLPAQVLSAQNIIGAMSTVPNEVQKFLKAMRELARPTIRRRASVSRKSSTDKKKTAR